MPVNGDTVVEINETLFVKIKAVSGVLVGEAQVACIIVNDDSVSLPAVFVRDASIAEGNSGTKSLSVRVELSASSTVPIKVSYATAGGTAKSGGDFHSTTGTLTFGPGAKVLSVTVPIIGDAQYEPKRPSSSTSPPRPEQQSATERDLHDHERRPGAAVSTAKSAALIVSTRDRAEKSRGERPPMASLG